ncbi:hypothetical protein VTN00DRAFT_2674 [Thermoascus crustaceus]|uniref:uncharacterized protein n=1 Tax=Thermoascus crustaceus TaxID=5088 RepID=UPI0037422687
MENITLQEVLQEQTGENTTLREQVNQLQNKLQNQINGNNQLHEQIHLLGQQAGASTNHTSNLAAQDPTNPDVNSKTKIVKPDLYYDNQKKLQTFISQLELYFFFNLHEFPNEERKDCLERSSEQQQAETTKTFNSFNAFLTCIKQNFRDLDEVKKATRTIMSIQQKTSVTNYTMEFQQAATFLGDWSE